MYRKLHCDFSNGPYTIAAATITSPSNNYGAAILFESGIYIFESGIYIFESGVYFAQHACSGVYYDLQPELGHVVSTQGVYTFKKLSDIPEDRFPMTQRAEGV